MTGGFTTWDEIGRLDGDVLAILSSPADDHDAVDALFDALARRVDASAIHVIAGPAWRAYLADYGCPADRVLFAVDDHGGEIELNHFLETPAVLRWAALHRFRTILGSAVHGAHNEEVKDIFEQRVCLLLGDGRFLAHTLPGPYVFQFDLPALLHRLGRSGKVEAYAATCRALIDDLHGVWQRGGRPAVADGDDFSDVVPLLARHLGPAVLAFDEASPIPLPRDHAAGSLVGFVTHLHLMLVERDERLAALQEAVNLRDTIIDDLRRDGDTVLRRLRRKLGNG